MQNQFGIRQEGLSWQRIQLNEQYGNQQATIGYQRMQLTDAQNLWNLDFGQETSKLQQSFTRQDWQYQDTTRALTQGWQAEDYAEAIRFSTGRERRKLIKQRDRATVMQGLEGEQVDQSRSQQEQLSAREDERYKSSASTWLL